MNNYKEFYVTVCLWGANLYLKPLNKILKHVVKLKGLEGYKLGADLREAVDIKHLKSYDEDLDLQSLQDLFEKTKEIDIGIHKEKHKNFMSKIFKGLENEV